MVLSKAERNIFVCQKYIETTNAKGTEVESFLTQFLLVNICGEFEKDIKEMLFDRADKCGDPDVASYIKNSFDGRSIKLGDIKGTILKKFNDKHGKTFDEKLKLGDAEVCYNNIIENRDSSAHGRSVNMSFDELIASYYPAKRVMTAMFEVLNL